MQSMQFKNSKIIYAPLHCVREMQLVMYQTFLHSTVAVRCS